MIGKGVLDNPPSTVRTYCGLKQKSVVASFQESPGQDSAEQHQQP
jgi:hypothetical protein